jgi:TM2 domain-containing membrane protein YozV
VFQTKPGLYVIVIITITVSLGAVTAGAQQEKEKLSLEKKKKKKKKKPLLPAWAVGALFRGARCIYINHVCENVSLV